MLISKFTAKVDVNHQATVKLISRKKKDDERDEDWDEGFVPKRLGKDNDLNDHSGKLKMETTSRFYFSRAYVWWSTLSADYHQLSTWTNFAHLR